MTFESHARICLRHAAAVVYDLDQGLAGILHIYTDIGGSCVHRILHEFLYNRCGTLDHLARRYLVCH